MPAVQLQFPSMSMSNEAIKAWSEYHKQQNILRLRLLSLKNRSVKNV